MLQLSILEIIGLYCLSNYSKKCLSFKDIPSCLKHLVLLKVNYFIEYFSYTLSERLAFSTRKFVSFIEKNPYLLNDTIADHIWYNVPCRMFFIRRATTNNNHILYCDSFLNIFVLYTAV